MNEQRPFLLIPKRLAEKRNWDDVLLGNVRTYVNVEIPFQDTHADISTLRTVLEQIRLSIALRLICIANRTLAAPTLEDWKPRQQRLLNWLASQEDIERINWFWREKEGAPMAPFFRGQMLELFRWALLFCPNETRSDSQDDVTPETKRLFFKAALIASELWGTRVHEMALVAHGELFGEEALAFSRHSIDANATAPDLWRTLGRARSLFRDYVPRFWDQFDRVFQTRTNISVVDFQCCAAALVASYLVKPEDTGLLDLSRLGENLASTQALDQFMELVASDPDQLREEIWTEAAIRETEKGIVPDYYTKLLRETPVLRINENLGAIVDSVFFSDVLLVGPLFQTVKGMNRGDSKEAFGKFGEAFEAYALDILERILKKDRDIDARRIWRNLTTEGFEIDAVACKRKLIFAFEVKSVFIPEREIVARDPDLFLQALRKRYVIDDESDRPLKAIGQLARLVRVLDGGASVFPDYDERPENLLLFPIMVAHDRLLTAPLTGRFLNHELQALLSPEVLLPSRQMRLSGGLRVAPLAILTIEDLEDFEVSSTYLSLTEVIKQYTDRFPGRELGLHDYIATSHFRGRMSINTELVGQGQELLRETGIRLFGRDVDEESKLE